MLVLIKLFLDIKGVICIAAVDFNRLRQAWLQKYKIVEGSKETGEEYLDKIFQIRVGVPRPPRDEVQKYLKTLVSGIPKEILDIFVGYGPQNPRAIKKILNLVTYRTQLLYDAKRYETATIWTLLEYVLTNKLLIGFLERVKGQGQTLGSMIYSLADDPRKLDDFLHRITVPDIDQISKNRHILIIRGSNPWAKRVNYEPDKLDKDFDILFKITNEAIS